MTVTGFRKFTTSLTARGAGVGEMSAVVPTKSWSRDSEIAHSDSERQRVERLHQFGALDTPDDQVFRCFAEQALVLVPGSSIGAVSLVDTDRQWFKSIIGLDMKQTCRSVSFCSHTIQTPGVMIVNDATKDERFAGNPLVTAAPAIRFYAGVRLVDGVGALCVIGTEPQQITGWQIERLVRLARYVDIQLLARGSLFNLQASDQAKSGP